MSKNRGISPGEADFEGGGIPETNNDNIISPSRFFYFKLVGRRNPVRDSSLTIYFRNYI